MQSIIDAVNNKFGGDLVCLDNALYYAAQEGYLVKETADGAVLVSVTDEDIANRLVELQELFFAYYCRNDKLPEIYLAEIEALESLAL
jgi:hypothetical protein